MARRRGLFVRFSQAASRAAGSPKAFVLAVAIVLGWAATGPMYDFSDTWQIVINTGTTIVTFLLVFLIQSSQNRDTKALQIKLDELIRATEGAHTVLLDLEELSDEELCKINDKYERLAAESRELLRRGESDSHVPNMDLNN